MLEKLLTDVESIINTLACNEAQPIEIRGAFNAAINLRSMLEQVNPADMPKPEVNVEVKAKEEPIQKPTKWRIPGPEDTNNETNE